MRDVFYHDNINFIFRILIYFVLECVAKNEHIVSVCGNTMCYLNYREAEVQVLKRTVYLNTVQEYTMALSCVMTSSVIFLKSYMSKSICTETMLKLCNTLALEFCVNYFLTIDGLYNGANCKFISSGC